MRWYIDGHPVFDTLANGNQTGDLGPTNHVFSVDLEPGHHTVAVLVRSGSAGWKLHAAAGKAQAEAFAQARLDNADRARQAAAYARQIEAQAAENRVLKLAIVGSSVALGQGAVGHFGWGNQLKEHLEATGDWVVENRSVPGDNTVKVLARFERDILADKPDVVLLALSMANEGLNGPQPHRIYQQYSSNLLKLAQLCQAHGITPIITNCYPHGGYDELRHLLVRKFNENLAAWPVASIDFLGGLDDGTGRWKAGTYADAGHPSDQGHEQMYRAVPTTWFTGLLEGQFPIESDFRGMMDVEGQGSQAPLFYQSDRPLELFTLVFDFLPAARRAQVAELGPWKLHREAQGELILRHDDGPVVMACPLQAGRRAQIALQWNGLEGQLRLLVDGEILHQLDTALEIDAFALGDPQGQVHLANVRLYRTEVAPAQLRALCLGARYQSSLELFAPLSDSLTFPGCTLLNLAPGNQAAILR